ncbi:anaphase promoting complex subunit 2 [Sporobolomyces salmoneus]|uniref:anaphase promoting complex subunit 2 n=1 Tax=Sporobolomyces salmoneus TaxID=183962 RepID=UPI0031780869
MELDILAAWQNTKRDLNKPTNRISELSEAWAIATEFIDPRTVAAQERLDPSPQVVNAIKCLEGAGMMNELLDDYLDSLRKSFNLVESQVVAHLDQFEAVDGEAKFTTMLGLLHSIGAAIKRWQQPITLFWPTSAPLTSYRKTFLSSLYYLLPPRFAPALQSFLRVLLSFPNPTASAPPDYPLAFPTLITLLNRYDPLLFALIYEEIETRTIETCRGKYREKQLEGLLKWLTGGGGEGVMGWVTGIYEGNLEGGNEEAKKFLKPTFSRFEYHVHKVLCQLRTTELFDIILDYPHSKPALDDLKLCLVKTDQRSLLVSRLRQQLDLRLLHPGTDTKDIITLYISTIRCLRIVDPPGVLLSRVTDPIRRYLRARKDTIRCIVSSLIEEGNPLFEELTTSDAKLVSDSKDEAENYTDQKWLPDPADAPPEFRKSRGADVIQLLVSIYDTKEVFVKELQVLLAQRLLLIRDYSFEKEIKNVAVLKGRFGEQSLQGCDVMLKDLEDSRKIDQGVHDAAPNLPLHATVVSRLFWPSFQSAPLKLPGQIGRVQSAYDRSFSKLKADKKLKWLPQLGNVNMTIELKDRSVTVDATPVQAAVIEMFDKQNTWTPEALQTDLKLSDLATVRNALFFWNNLGVVKSLPDDQWQLAEEQGQETAEESEQVAHVIEEEKEAVQSVEEQGVAQMRVFWQYIQGMLTNLGTLPIARIHSTLNMLAPGYKGKTTDELKALLEAVEAEGLVRKTPSGSWKIVK